VKRVLTGSRVTQRLNFIQTGLSDGIENPITSGFAVNHSIAILLIC
jgi:hypothetical protein